MWLLFLSCCFFGVVSSYQYKPSQKYQVQGSKTPITNEQWNHIKNILKNKSTNPSIKKKVHHILYTKYENMAYWKAYQFKKFHSYKCRDISLAELSLYSKIGLYKAIEKYNPQYHFYPYLDTYINGELFKGLTDLYPICSISKRERMKKKNFSIIHFVPSQTYKGDNKELQLERFENAITSEKKALFIKKLMHNKLLNTKFVGKDDWLIDKNLNHNENAVLQTIVDKETYEEVWYKINHSLDITPFQKRIFYLKYDSHFNKIRSNRKVAEFMECSEEYVRRQLSIHF
jgi:DNA-directed RNA polymerase specialized sigma subunit